jgi:hypothetical protein
MFGINNKPYIDLDPYLKPQMQELWNLKKSMSISIAKVMAKKSGVDDYRNWIKYVYPKSFEGMAAYENIRNFDPIVDEEIAALSIRERELYFKLQYGLYPPITYISIKDIKAWAPMGDDNDHSHFEFLKDWANTLPFEEIKVIRLMIQEPGQKILLHTDYDEHQIAKFVKENKHPPVKEAIYCSPFENKKFYIYDEKSNTKHYVKSKSSLWNMGDWHGADSTEFPAWTLMIYGTYTQEFRETLCL